MIHRIHKAINSRIKRFFNKFGGGGNSINGISLFRRLKNFEIKGTGNTIILKSNLSKSVKIVLYGNNHKLIIEEDVVFKQGTIWFEDYGCEIHIGVGTTIEQADLAVAENGTKLIIGNDCMFSRGIHIATTDSHSVINVMTGERTNHAKDVIIGNHVWLGYCVSIGKGVCIGNNAVVAGHSVVTKSVPCNTIVAGNPAMVVKDGTTWNRIRI